MQRGASPSAHWYSSIPSLFRAIGIDSKTITIVFFRICPGSGEKFPRGIEKPPRFCYNIWDGGPFGPVKET